MKASIWLGGDKFEIRDIPIPEIKEDEVLVKVKRVGLCGTDVHITQGLFPSTPPKILGHEFSGDIVDVGKNVDKTNSSMFVYGYVLLLFLGDIKFPNQLILPSNYNPHPLLEIMFHHIYQLN